jgi:hypothetical protein
VDDKIDGRNYFLWQLMDGEHDLGGLAKAHCTEYRAFPFDRLSQLIAQLKANTLLQGASPPVETAQVGESKRGRLAWRTRHFGASSAGQGRMRSLPSSTGEWGGFSSGALLPLCTDGTSAKRG